MTKTAPDPQAVLAAARVPRYTSYPPANHFSGAVGPDEVARWIGSLDVARPVSAYVHIPFCRRLCWFCACRTQGTATARPVEDYLDRLEVEIARTMALAPDRMSLGALHLGGGTPSLLTPDQIARLFAALAAAFDWAPGATRAVEIDPTELDEARLDAFAAVGITRASIGVQDFAPEVQAAIGRMQSVAETRAAIEGLRARGVGGINVDLLYGLPHQTRASLGTTLDEVIALAPDRIALYGYAHVPWVSRRQRLIPEAALPDSAGRQALFADARRRLIWAGYVPVGIDHFARPGDSLAAAATDGTLRRNFQGYTTDRAEPLIGFGASALSRFPQGHAQNAPATAAWAEALEAGRLPVVRGHAMSAEDSARAEVIERLLCDFAVDFDTLVMPARLRATLLSEAALLAESLAPEVRLEGSRLVLARSDGSYARLAASAFDGYLDRAQLSYSLAI